MKKAELLRYISAETHLTQADVNRVLETLSEVATQQLQKAEEFTIHNLVTFKVKHRAARQGVNPQNGSPITIPAKKVVQAKATYLQNQIN